jgi:hypothetical protein
MNREERERVGSILKTPLQVFPNPFYVTRPYYQRQTFLGYMVGQGDLYYGFDGGVPSVILQYDSLDGYYRGAFTPEAHGHQAQEQYKYYSRRYVWYRTALRLAKAKNLYSGKFGT